MKLQNTKGQHLFYATRKGANGRSYCVSFYAANWKAARQHCREAGIKLDGQAV